MIIVGFGIFILCMCRQRCQSVRWKKLINNSIVVHYVAGKTYKTFSFHQNTNVIFLGGYTVNNAVLYGNGLFLLITWILDALGRGWDLYSIIPSCVGCGLLGICFCFSNWRSYSRVTKSYLERMLPVEEENSENKNEAENKLKASKQQPSINANHSIENQQQQYQQTDGQGIVIAIENNNQQSNFFHEHETTNNNNNEENQSEIEREPIIPRKHPIIAKLEKISAIGASILKAVASSASWFTFVEGFFGVAISLSTTLIFAPACIISQIAFLSIADADPKEEIEQFEKETNEQIAQIVAEAIQQHDEQHHNKSPSKSEHNFSPNNKQNPLNNSYMNSFSSFSSLRSGGGGERRPLLFQNTSTKSLPPYFLEEGRVSRHQSPWQSQRRYGSYLYGSRKGVANSQRDLNGSGVSSSNSNAKRQKSFFASLCD